MKQAKILILSSCFPSPQNPVSGIFVKSQIEAVRNLGNCHFVTMSPTPWVPPLATLFFKNAKNYFRPRRVLGTSESLFPRYLAIPGFQNTKLFYESRYRSIKKASRGKTFDLIHAHWASHDGPMALRLAKEWKVPFILTLHGYDVDRFPTFNSYTLGLFNSTVTEASKVIAVSSALAMKTKNLTGRRPEVLPVGIDFSKFNSSIPQTTARRELGLPEDKKIILFVGSLSEEKGIPSLLRAFALLSKTNPKLLLVLIGDGPLLEKAKMANNAIAPGPQPANEVSKWYRAADLFVLPSHREGLGQVLIEAGASGLPAIGANVGGIPEVLQNNKLLFEPGQSNELAQRILWALDHLDEIRPDPTALRKTFDLRANAESLKDFYFRTIAQARGQESIKSDLPT